MSDGSQRPREATWKNNSASLIFPWAFRPLSKPTIDTPPNVSVQVPLSHLLHALNILLADQSSLKGSLQENSVSGDRSESSNVVVDMMQQQTEYIWFSFGEGQCMRLHTISKFWNSVWALRSEIFRNFHSAPQFSSLKDKDQAFPLAMACLSLWKNWSWLIMHIFAWCVYLFHSCT